MNDKVGASDWIFAGLGEKAGPVFPCPRCGKESKEHHPKTVGEEEFAQRICSAPPCRFTGSPDQFRDKNVN